MYHRVYPDGTDITFNASGKPTSQSDRFGNTTTIWWAANYYGVLVSTEIFDPIGKSISLGYHTPSIQRRNSTDRQPRHGDQLRPEPAEPRHEHRCGLLEQPHALDDVDGVQQPYVIYDNVHRPFQAIGKNNGVRSYYYGYATTPFIIDDPNVIVNGAVTTPRSWQREPSSVFLLAAAGGGGTSASNAIAVATPTDLRASLTDVKSNTTYLTINRFGSPTKIEAPLLGPAYVDYDPLTGQVARTMSPTGDVVRNTWVGDQLRQTIDSTLGQTVNIDYETQYSLPKHIYGNVAEQWLTYDQTKTGWPLKTVQVGSSGAPVSNYLFDNYGRITSVSDPAGHTTSFLCLFLHRLSESQQCDRAEWTGHAVRRRRVRSVEQCHESVRVHDEHASRRTEPPGVDVQSGLRRHHDAPVRRAEQPHDRHGFEGAGVRHRSKHLRLAHSAD